MISLTDEQLRELSQATDSPVEFFDPHSSQKYFLVTEVDFERIRELLQDDKEQRVLAETAWRSLSHLLKDEPW